MNLLYDKIVFDKNEIYNSILVEKIITKLFKNGKKEKLEIIFHKIYLFFKIKKLNFILIIFYIIERLRPTVEYIPVTKSGRRFFTISTTQLPRQYTKAITWFITAIKKSSKKKILLKIINEIFKINFFSKSYAFTLRRNNFKLIYKNKAFIHFRWR